MNFCLIGTGGMLLICFIIILCINMSIYNNNQILVTLLDKELMDCSVRKCDNIRADQLVYYSGTYTADKNAFDKDFNVDFQDPIVSRDVRQAEKTEVKRDDKWESK